MFHAEDKDRIYKWSETGLSSLISVFFGKRDVLRLLIGLRKLLFIIKFYIYLYKRIINCCGLCASHKSSFWYKRRKRWHRLAPVLSIYGFWHSRIVTKVDLTAGWAHPFHIEFDWRNFGELEFWLIGLGVKICFESNNNVFEGNIWVRDYLIIH